MKELNIPQKSMWYHLEDTFGDKVYRGIIRVPNTVSKYHDPKKGNTYYSAFTVGELGDMLPFKCDAGCLNMGKEDNKFYCGYEKQENGELVVTGHYIESKEVDARAKMLIRLISENVIKLK